MNARHPIGVLATSPAAIERAAQTFRDRQLSANLDTFDRAEANDQAARRHVNDKHIAEAVEMVKDNLRNQIDAGKVSVYDASILLAIFDRIEDVAVECSWADLCKEANHG